MMKSMLTVAALSVLLASTPAAAYPHEGMALDAAWLGTPREYQVHWNQQGFQVLAPATHADHNDTVQISFDAAKHEFILGYLPADDPDIQNLTTLLRIRLVAVVEFQDQDEDLRYSLGDPIVRRIPIEEMFRPTLSSTHTEEGQELRIDYGVPQSFRSRLQLTLTVPDPASEAAANATSWFPLQVGFSNFEFRSDNQTRLALETRVTPGGILDPVAVGVEEGRTQAFWAWSPTAESDGVAHPVGSTLQPYAASEGEVTLVIFSHGRNATLTHDTTLGVLRTAATPGLPVLTAIGDWRVFLVGFVVAGGVMFATVRHVMGREE